jgi:putative FmdB family regulatory protein
MPIYDFLCTSCNHKAEVMRKISAPSVDVCPACGSETFAKQLSAPSFQLTGSGWYATDFKGEKKSEVKAGESNLTETKPAESKSADANPATVTGNT